MKSIDDDAARLRCDLVDTLWDNGYLTDPAWRSAFVSVPRHPFVPHIFRTHLHNGYPHTEVIDAADPDWLTTVYADEPLQIRRDVTSSSTSPGLMARMLEALDLAGTEKVLEIGTGSGYNCALLCQRLGSDRVTSIDVEPELADHARAHLASVGYAPNVVVGDGAQGHPPLAPYQRIIATCRIEHISWAWLDQLTPDGVIVAPLGTSIVRIVRHPESDQDEHLIATGHFLTAPAYFMPMRAAPGREDMAVIARNALRGPGESRPSDLGIDIFSNPDARTWLEFIVPGIVRGSTNNVDFAYHRDGSWARFADGTVTQSGPRALWDDVEAAHASWLDNQRPNLGRYGLTITSHHQRLWLDTPTAVIHELPRL